MNSILKRPSPSDDLETAPESPISTVGSNGKRIDVRIARSLDDMMMAFAIRSAVFLAEQSCPYDEEFDGNDATATHVLAMVDGEPAATIRIRYFGGFAKMERMAIRREFRGLTLALKVAHYAIEFVRRKGFELFITNMQLGEGREKLWAMVYRRYGGFHSIPGLNEFSFSAHDFKPVQVHMAPGENAMHTNTDPNVINRPEGDWDRPGILEVGQGKLPSQSRKLRV